MYIPKPLRGIICLTARFASHPIGEPQGPLTFYLIHAYIQDWSKIFIDGTSVNQYCLTGVKNVFLNHINLHSLR